MFFDKTFTHTFLISVVIILMLIVFYQTTKIDQLVSSNHEILRLFANSTGIEIINLTMAGK